MDPFFLKLEQILRLHQRLIEKFGGTTELRDQGLLESAIEMPAAQFGGEYLHGSVPEMAAAYLFHLCRNHPFVDGNKRVALASAEVFLNVNGWQLVASNDQLETVTLSVAASEMEKQKLTEFFISHCEIMESSES